MNEMSNIVAIVGRPNVGKSTLFNRLTESRKAIVDSVSGVTRDRHYGKAEWNGKEFSVVDTGGYVINSEDIFEEEIRKQVMVAIEEADAIIFMVDVSTGITAADEIVAAILRKSRKKIFLTVNKVDNFKNRAEAAEFYSLGLGEIYMLSSISGSGTGELLDDLVKSLNVDVIDETATLPRFAIIGRPNVGKSSLINALTGKERNIVTPIAGTTRDAIDTRYNSFGFDFILVDTAGVRKKTKVHEDLEFYSVMRSIRAIEESDVCILLIDGTEEISSQDINIFLLAEKNSKGIVILVNKWDLVEKNTNKTKEVEKQIREKLQPFTNVPIVFTSVLNKQRIFKALETAVEVFQNRKKKISTSELNNLLLPIIEQYPPPAIKGKYVKVKYITQLHTATPSFAFFCNSPQYIQESYKRFLENKLREKFDFTGVPIRIYFREK